MQKKYNLTLTNQDYNGRYIKVYGIVEPQHILYNMARTKCSKAVAYGLSYLRHI